MADKTTTSLTGATTPLDGAELHYVIQGGNSRKVAGSEIVKISHNQAWSTITSTPTTLDGYGITDAATSTQGGKADTALQPGDIGDTVQAHEDQLDDLAALAPGSDGQVIGWQDGELATFNAAGGGDLLSSNNLSDLDSAADGRDNLGLGTMATETASDYTKTADLAAVATSNDYGDLDNLPTLGTAAAEDTTAFATAAQGSLADTAFQPADAPDDDDLSNDTDKLALRGNIDANLVLQYAADDTALKALDIGSRKAALNLANEHWWLPTSDDISTMIVDGDPRYLPTSDDTSGASGGWYQAGSVASGQKYENLGARIERLADRLMVGGEAVKFNGLADGSGGKGGFLWDLLPGATQSHAWMEQQALLSVGGIYNVDGAVSLNTYLAGPGVALNTHLLHDRSSDTDSPSEAWCFYVDSRRDIEHGSTWGAEFDIINGLPSPHTSFGPWGGSAGAVGGRTVALHLGSGGGASVNGTTYPADVALLVQKNSSTFYSGIAFGAQSLEPDAGTGRMHAIALAPKQAIDWWGSNLAAGILASIVSNVTDTSVPQELMFQDTGLNFTSGGNTLLHVNAIASAASYLTLTPAVTGGAPTVATAGAASTISLSLRSKGAATATLIQSDAVTAFSATGIASGVNRLDALAAVTGTPAQLRALGSDTNIDLQLTPKGTGNVRLGTHTALGSETVTGYITVKDAAGNARKLAVVS